MIDYKTEGAVARITLNRPEKRNAITPELLEGITNGLRRAAEDPAVRVVLLAGAGPDFCAGMDITLLRETTDAGVLEHLDMARRLGETYRAMRRHPHPVVAAVKGRALGGGCGIATACDVVLAAEGSAQFGYPEVKIGFVPATVMVMLRRTVGEKRAFDLLVRGEPIGAREAFDLGLVTRVYPDAEFDAGVEAYLAELAARSASAVTLTKRQMYHIDSMSFDAALEAAEHINALARMTDDARSGFERFIKKQK